MSDFPLLPFAMGRRSHTPAWPEPACSNRAYWQRAREKPAPDYLFWLQSHAQRHRDWATRFRATGEFSQATPFYWAGFVLDGDSWSPYHFAAMTDLDFKDRNRILDKVSRLVE